MRRPPRLTGPRLCGIGMAMAYKPEDILSSLLDAAKRAGADAADALFVENLSASVSYRLGKLEDVERSESADLGLRVFLGSKVAFVSSTDFSPEALAGLPQRAIAMARLAPEDKYAGLAPKERLAKTIPALDLEDAEEPAPEILVARARDAEAAASLPGRQRAVGQANADQQRGNLRQHRAHCAQWRQVVCEHGLGAEQGHQGICADRQNRQHRPR